MKNLIMDAIEAVAIAGLCFMGATLICICVAFLLALVTGKW